MAWGVRSLDIKLTIKIDFTDDGICTFWRAGYGFVLEPVEMKICCTYLIHYILFEMFLKSAESPRSSLVLMFTKDPG